MSKPGRNDPCPCGSGQKYKKCCMLKERERAAVVESRMAGIGRALDWLYDRYPQEIAIWLKEEFFFTLDESEREDIAASRSAYGQMLDINLNELLLADGLLRIGRRNTDVMELVLGEGGPLMTVEQRQYLEKTHAAAMSLYEVLSIEPGEGMWVRDMLRPRQPTLFVRDRAASTQARPWDCFGFRPIDLGSHVELSGAIYPVPRTQAEWLIQSMKDAPPASRQPARKREIAHRIADVWLQLSARGSVLPQLRDAATGEAMMLVTDHYRVNDADALAARLASCPDVEGDAADGWTRFQSIQGDMMRSLVSINPGAKKGRIELFTRSLAAADAQKRWFEDVAGESVAFLTREIVDPVAAIRRNGPEPEVERRLLDEEERLLIREYKQKHYANWIDEPLPALDGKTARQAVKTAAGKKRVVALLKDFENREDGEEVPFDFAFLRDALGLKGDV